MDWKGQKLVEQLMQVLLTVFAVAALAVGYALGSFQTMMLIYASGVVITSFITIPDWPFLSRHPLKWLDPSQAEEHPKPELVVANSTSTKKKSSKK